MHATLFPPTSPPVRCYACSYFLVVSVLLRRLTGFPLSPQDFLLRTATPPGCVYVYISSYEFNGMNYVHLAAL